MMLTVEMLQEDINMLVCARTSGSTRPVYGSIRTNCTECQLPVWVSVSGQRAMKKDDDLKPFCIECAKEKVESADEKVKAEIVPGAVDELKRYFLNVENN